MGTCFCFQRIQDRIQGKQSVGKKDKKRQDFVRGSEDQDRTPNANSMTAMQHQSTIQESYERYSASGLDGYHGDTDMRESRAAYNTDTFSMPSAHPDSDPVMFPTDYYHGAESELSSHLGGVGATDPEFTNSPTAAISRENRWGREKSGTNGGDPESSNLNFEET